MKNLCYILLSLLLMNNGWELAAQSVLSFHYQAVARGNAGEILANTPTVLRFQIKSGSVSGPIIYQEVHNLSTNAYGLLNTQIGDGTVESGNFGAIPWGEGDFFLSVLLDGNLIETSQFEAVPYAKMATSMSLGHLQDVNAEMPLPDQVLKWNGSAWAPGTASSFSAGTGISISGGTITNTAPDQPVSLTGSGATSISGSYPNFTISSTGTAYTAGSGINITGADVISNTAPDQVVSLSGNGATSISGTYPNFTISSTDNVNDADASTTNEIQSMALSGNTLSLSLGGGSVSLASFASPWNNSGSNLYFNTGKVGIGDNSPVASLTVGNGDKFQVHGSDRDVVFKDDQGSIRFANSSGSNAPMIQMFQSGTNNSTRMLVAHSPNFSNWGIQYNDTADAFNWIGDNSPIFQIQLSGQERIGIGTFSPEAKVHVLANSGTGFGQLKLTETQFDYSRITMNNTVHGNFWDLAARTDTNLANAQFNIYHSDAGDIFSVNARGRVGINDASPSYAVEINGKQSTRIIHAYNTLPTTTNTTYNYGLRVNLSQSNNTGFPRLYNVYGISTDSDAYLSYGLYGYASGASSNNYGVYAYAPTSSGYAGYFNGDVYTTAAYLPSDVRIKSGIMPLEGGLEKVMRLQPKRYQYNRRQFNFLNLPEGEQYGFLAQDVEVLLPQLTRKAFQAYEEALSDTPEGQGYEFTAINYTGLIPIMVTATQEQQTLIEKQADRIQQLEQREQQLEDRLQTLEALVSTLKQD